MELKGLTVLITGGGSGIGRALAAALHERGNQVAICGWHEEPLKETCAEFHGMKYYVADVSDKSQVAALAGRVSKDLPSLNCVVNNAGIQRQFDFAKDSAINSDSPDQEIAINLKGLIYMTSAFLPVIRENPRPTLINVSSGLGFVPLASVPVYCATKAAVHSLTLSLRHQLKGLGVKVIEVIPPAVESNLHRGQPSRPPGAPTFMPLADFTTELIKALQTDEDEIALGMAVRLREGSRHNPKEAFENMNARSNP